LTIGSEFENIRHLFKGEISYLTIERRDLGKKFRRIGKVKLILGGEIK
jgi:hypothetical protein